MNVDRTGNRRHLAGRTSCATNGRTGQNSRHHPTRTSFGCVRDDKHQPWRRAVTPPAPTATTPAGLPPIRIRQGIARHEIVAAQALRSPTACYSMEATRSATRASCSQQKLAVHLRLRSRRGPDRARLRSCSIMLHADGNAAPDRSLRICSNMRHVPRVEGPPRSTHDDRSAPCACARVQAMVVRRYTHGGPSQGARSREIRFACVLGAITS